MTTQDPPNGEGAMPVFPMHLVDTIRRTEFYVILNDEMGTGEDISQIIERMFAEAESLFYLVVREGESFTAPLQNVLDAGEIRITLTDQHFYEHPNFRRDYVKIVGGGTRDWQRSLVARGRRFSRHTLVLSDATRRRLTAEEHLAIAEKKHKSPFEAKPGLWGFSIDLMKVGRWLKSWRSGKT